MEEAETRDAIFIATEIYIARRGIIAATTAATVADDERSCRRSIRLIAANSAEHLAAASSFYPRYVKKMQQYQSNVIRRCVHTEISSYHQNNYGRLTRIKIQRI